jgi:C-terminal processing protease CtpA/Prc
MRSGKLILALSLVVTARAGTWSAGETVAARASARPPGVTAAAMPPSPSALRNLEAFARLYGYVRWFYPGDEAATVDWNRMAVLGAGRVLSAADDAGLRNGLEALFLPVAPSLRVYRSGETPAPVAPPPAPASRWKTVAWQHLGMGQGRGPYLSGRTNRPRSGVGSEAFFGTITQAIPAAKLRGKRVRLRAAVRAEVAGAGNQGQLWLRVDRSGGRMGFFENMDGRPIRSSEWRLYEILGEVASDAERVVFGCLLKGHGKVFVDAVELAVEEAGGWRRVPVANAGFEAQPPTKGWQAEAPGYRFEATGVRPFEGVVALVIAKPETPTTSEPLFAEAPALGEAWEGELVPGLRARIPLAVAGDATSTWPVAGEQFAALRRELAPLDPAGWNAGDWRVRVAEVVIAWNVFEHFYPYFDVVGADWPAELHTALGRALTDADALALQTTLRLMVAAARDGHANVFNPVLSSNLAGLPCILAVIERRMVVTAPDGDKVLQQGDIIEAVDGLEAMTVLAEKERVRSGTAQWRRVGALRSLGSGAKGTAARLRIERDGKQLEVDLYRKGEPPASDHLGEPVARLASGAWYVDLTRASIDAVRPHLDELAAAPAVVFDMRGYPKGGAEELLEHLTDKPMQSPIWQVPHITYPDLQRVTSWDLGGRWELPPLTPRFRGRVAFLTGPSAISYAESIMGIVEAYQLGEIVGANTAGTNGDVNSLDLPGGYRVVFTGMRVLKHDGSQHHLVGIHPTVPAERTIAGVRAGRDEVLEAALRSLASTRPQDQRGTGVRRPLSGRPPARVDTRSTRSHSGSTGETAASSASPMPATPSRKPGSSSQLTSSRSGSLVWALQPASPTPASRRAKASRNQRSAAAANGAAPVEWYIRLKSWARPADPWHRPASTTPPAAAGRAAAVSANSVP